MTMDFWDAAALSTSVAAADRPEGMPGDVSNSTPSVESTSAASAAGSDTELVPATPPPPLPVTATDPWDLAVLGAAIGSEQTAAVPPARQDEPAVGRLIDVSLQSSALAVDTSAPVEAPEHLPPLSAVGETAADDDGDNNNNNDSTDGGAPLATADAVVATAAPVPDDSDDLPAAPVPAVPGALPAVSASDDGGLVDMALGDATAPPFAAGTTHSSLSPKTAPVGTSLSAAVATAEPRERFRQAPELTSKHARQQVCSSPLGGFVERGTPRSRQPRCSATGFVVTAVAYGGAPTRGAGRAGEPALLGGVGAGRDDAECAGRGRAVGPHHRKGTAECAVTTARNHCRHGR